MSSCSYSNPPCAACKSLRRKCTSSCIFAPYFPPEDTLKFANVHRIFGASNVSKLLNAIDPEQRQDAANSLAYEAEARMRDPVHGCVAAISVLQRQVLRLQKELDNTNADLMRYASCHNSNAPRVQENPYLAGLGYNGPGFGVNQTTTLYGHERVSENNYHGYMEDDDI